MIRTSLGLLAAAGALVAGFAVLNTPSIASAAPAGAATISVATGTASTNFNLTIPSGSACTNSGSNGYLIETYIASKSVNVENLKFVGGTIAPLSTYTLPGGAFIGQLADTGGTTVADLFPSSSPLGLISGIPQVNLNTLVGSLPVGQYQVGVFCANNNAGGEAGRLDANHYWQTYITVTNAGTLAWKQGWAPDAPVLGSLTADSTQFSGSFTYTNPVTVTAPGPSTATTGFTVTATPTAGAGFPGAASTLSVALGASPVSFTFTGLVNATTYNVTVHSTNLVGDSPESNTVAITVNPVPRAAVTGLTATPGTGSVALAWTAPTGVAPLSYDVVVSPSVAGSPFSVAGLSTTITGLTAGTSYTFTVTPIHTSPFVGTAASTSAVPLAAQVITQDITVTRPVGALVLTQRCGVNGALPSESATPGFAVLPILPASVDQTGFAPTTDVNRTVSDTNFGEYPYPVDASNVPNEVYPTHCGLNLGIARLVTDPALGNVAGQYFAVDGHLNQVTVVDTRDTDSGWTLSGSVTNFTHGSDTFSGNYLGWTPVVTSTSGTTLEGYDQTVAAGSTVAPAFASGLTSPKTLASAVANQGLGIAVLDARLKLLIPVTANSGVYTATLTFTVV